MVKVKYTNETSSCLEYKHDIFFLINAYRVKRSKGRSTLTTGTHPLTISEGISDIIPRTIALCSKPGKNEYNQLNILSRKRASVSCKIKPLT